MMRIYVQCRVGGGAVPINLGKPADEGKKLKGHFGE